MTVLDAYAVLAYLQEEPAAGLVADLLREPATMSSVNAAETIDKLVRIKGRAPDDAHADLLMLTVSGLEIVPATAEIGIEAGRLRARHYDRVTSAVSTADCFAAATALRTGTPVATCDPALVAMVRAEKGAVIALPNSKGRLP